MKKCEYYNRYGCERPATCYIEYNNGRRGFYCAVCYDLEVKELTELALAQDPDNWWATAVLRRNGLR